MTQMIQAHLDERLPQQDPDFSAAAHCPQCDAFTIDVTETGNGYLVHAELPNMSRDDIEVLVAHDAISIDAGPRGRRSLWFNRNIDGTGAVARYECGVLEIVLPKLAGASPCRLAIE